MGVPPGRLPLHRGAARLYELADEVRFVHEHLPHAFMAGIFVLPLDSAEDKLQGNSSFGHTVLKLRQRTGRLDPSLPNHAPRCDVSYVGLYATGGETQGFPAGVVRFLNVQVSPPFSGRPQIASTRTLPEVVEEIVTSPSSSAHVDWSEPESD